MLSSDNAWAGAHMGNAATLWALSTYYNPARYRRRLSNYRAFRRGLGVPLVTVELGHHGAFELTPADADVLVQISDGSVLWQKERLLNVALEHIPRTAKSVAWLDCDVAFQREDWARAATGALKTHVLVQLFDFFYDAAIDGSETPWDCHPAQPTGVSIAALMSRGIWDVNDFAGVPSNSSRRCGFGFGWAVRKSVIEKHGFYDAMILGGGDRALVSAAYGRFDAAIQTASLDSRRAQHYRRWAQPFFDDVRANVGCLQGSLLHRWHGDLTKRQYLQRHTALAEFDFDPQRDISIANSGAWTWASDKPRLHEYVRQYFHSRDEDGMGAGPRGD